MSGTQGLWHTDNEGTHKVCDAGKGRCPYSKKGHFATEAEAVASYAEDNRGGLFAIFSRSKKKSTVKDSVKVGPYDPSQWAKPDMFKEGAIPTREEFLAQEINAEAFPWAKTTQLPTAVPVYTDGVDASTITPRSLAERQMIIPAWNKEVAAFVVKERINEENANWIVDGQKLTVGMAFKGVKVIDPEGKEIYVEFDQVDAPSIFEASYKEMAQAGKVTINGLPTSVLPNHGIDRLESSIPIYDTATGRVDANGFAASENDKIGEAYMDTVYYNFHEVFESVMTPDGNHVLKLHPASAQATGDDFKVAWTDEKVQDLSQQYNFILVEKTGEEYGVNYYLF